MLQTNHPHASAAHIPFQRRKRMYVLWLIVALGLVGMGSWQLASRWRAVSGTAALPNSQVVVTNDAPDPAESKPAEQDYVVPADQPRRIILDSIEASGLIQKVGITKDNAIATPTNINFAGWYVNSAKPGEDGLSIIDGHVSGKYSDAIFRNLKKLELNAMFSVEFGDKSTRRFKVVATETVPEKDAASKLLAKRANISKQLNVITCGGAYNKNTQTFSERTIVIAEAQ